MTRVELITSYYNDTKTQEMVNETIEKIVQSRGKIQDIKISTVMDADDDIAYSVLIVYEEEIDKALSRCGDCIHLEVRGKTIKYFCCLLLGIERDESDYCNKWESNK